MSKSTATNISELNFLMADKQATPRLSEDKAKQCVDPKLGNDYPPKAVAKVSWWWCSLSFRPVVIACSVSKMMRGKGT
jgi:hypothetical protein